MNVSVVTTWSNSEYWRTAQSTPIGMARASVTKNAAPRAVYESMLTGTMSKSRYSNLFRGSGSFTTAERGTFRALIVDVLGWGRTAAIHVLRPGGVLDPTDVARSSPLVRPPTNQSWEGG